MFKKRKPRRHFERSLKRRLRYKTIFFSYGCCKLRQQAVVKGNHLLTAEIGFIYWLIRNGFHALMMLGTLGTQQQGLVYDDSLGIEVLKEGDNSMLLLLFGIAAILVCLSLIILYVINLKAPVTYMN